MMYDAVGVAKAPAPNAGLQRVPGYKKLDGALLGSSELKKIETLAYATENQKKQITSLGERHDTLKSISAERIKNWPNTIDAMRLQGERRREERLMRDEARKQVIDQEEKELREVQKKKTLIDAEKKLFQTNDKVKAFNSHLQTYHTMLERQEQLTIKDNLNKSKALRDEMLSRQEAETVERQAAADALRVKEKLLIQEEVKQAQLQQIHEKKQQLIAERAEAKLEQARLRQMAKDQENADRIKLEQAKLKGKILAQERQEQNQRNIQLKREEKENAARSTSQLDRNQFLSTKGMHEEFLAERKQQREIAKLQRIARSYDDLAAIRNAQEEALLNLETKRREEGVLGMDERMTTDDHSRLLKSKSEQKIGAGTGGGSFYQPNERALRSQRHEASKERHRLETIRRNFEADLEEEIAEKEQKRRQAKRHQKILLLQQKEKEAQRILERLGELEERKEMELATKNLNEEASQYINQSLVALKISPTASKYLSSSGGGSPAVQEAGNSSSSPLKSVSSPTKSKRLSGGINNINNNNNHGQNDPSSPSTSPHYDKKQLQEHLHPSMYKSMNLSTMEVPALGEDDVEDMLYYDSDGSPQRKKKKVQVDQSSPHRTHANSEENRTSQKHARGIFLSSPPRTTDLQTSALMHLQKHSSKVTK